MLKKLMELYVSNYWRALEAELFLILREEALFECGRCC
jgi:hypothetical protein